MIAWLCIYCLKYGKYRKLKLIIPQITGIVNPCFLKSILFTYVIQLKIEQQFLIDIYFIYLIMSISRHISEWYHQELSINDEQRWSHYCRQRNSDVASSNCSVDKRIFGQSSQVPSLWWT